MACRYATLSGRTNLLVGYVKPDNIPSLKAFRKCGFIEDKVVFGGNNSLMFSLKLK
jgi:RimJ/RimL family protein N-acetyltransferase